MKHTEVPLAKTVIETSKKKKGGTRRAIRKNLSLYLLLLLPFVYILVFKYYPMYGAQIAFKDYNPALGIEGSPWVGLKHFINFFQSYIFKRVITNTLSISIYSLLVGFPIPILLALSLNYSISKSLKRTVQMITYAPHFISTVVIVGILLQFLATRNGLINNLIELFGGKRVDFLGSPQYFSSIYVWSGIWQNMGFSSIIYISALAGVDPELHEAAVMDGATILQRIRHIDLPSIQATITILLILSCGNVLTVGYEKILLMQNDLNLTVSEVIDTYVYKIGLASPLGNYSYASAIGLFTSAINFSILLVVNKLAAKIGHQSLI